MKFDFDFANFEVFKIYRYTAAKKMNQPLVVGENIFQQYHLKDILHESVK